MQVLSWSACPSRVLADPIVTILDCSTRLRASLSWSVHPSRETLIHCTPWGCRSLHRSSSKASASSFASRAPSDLPQLCANSHVGLKVAGLRSFSKLVRVRMSVGSSPAVRGRHTSDRPRACQDSVLFRGECVNVHTTCTPFRHRLSFV